MYGKKLKTSLKLAPSRNKELNRKDMVLQDKRKQAFKNNFTMQMQSCGALNVINNTL